MVIDVVVVGAGPNGLAAAITVAQAGRSVTLLEARPAIGGGTRTAELTLPGFHHDVCSAIHPFAAISPFFRTAQLDRHGLELVHPEIAHVHPLDDGRAGVLHRSLPDTIAGLGVDGRPWDRHIGWTVRHWDDLVGGVMGPLAKVPRHPLAMAGFGARGLMPATVAGKVFRTDEAAGLFAGAAAHAFLPLTRPFTTAMGMMLLVSGHVAGWPVVKGGSERLAEAMGARLTELGGTIEVDHAVRSLADIPPARAVLFDLTPRQLLDICGDDLPAGYRRRMGRFRYGPGVCKVDFALSEPVPWANEHGRRAGSLHLGGTLQEIAFAEAEVAAGRHPDRPFVLVGQQSLPDPSRAPAGRHTLWTYCHAPSGSDVDMTMAIEEQIERFAPGFKDVVLARHTAGSGWFEDYNANYIGGDIAGGSHAGLQLLLRPGLGLRPYRTGNPRFYLCSASTPPGGGVHGMGGYNAATAALRAVLN